MTSARQNINVDNPILGQPYRIMVHNYSTHGNEGEIVHPLVNIYCGGALRASFGADAFVPMMDDDQWLVADVVFVRGPCGQDCQILPLGDLQAGTDDFGPAWSCRCQRNCTNVHASVRHAFFH